MTHKQTIAHVQIHVSVQVGQAHPEIINAVPPADSSPELCKCELSICANIFDA